MLLDIDQTWVRSRSRLRLHEAGSQVSESRLRLLLPDFKKSQASALASASSCRKALASALASGLRLLFSVVYYPICEFMLESHVLLSVSQKNIPKTIVGANDRHYVQFTALIIAPITLIISCGFGFGF